MRSKKATVPKLLAFDEQLRREGFSILAGLDEAGRGPLAGPVVAAAVILPPGLELAGVDDSKKLDAKKREAAFDLVTSSAISWAVSEISAEDVDRLNPLGAAMAAMAAAAGRLGVRPDLLLVDGNRRPPSDISARLVVKGDALSLSIAAASIVAKVWRDRLMLELHGRWPEYGFDRHKGYGTREHLEALRRYGPSPKHRLTFKGVKAEEAQGAFDWGEDG